MSRIAGAVAAAFVAVGTTGLLILAPSGAHAADSGLSLPTALPTSKAAPKTTPLTSAPAAATTPSTSVTDAPGSTPVTLGAEAWYGGTGCLLPGLCTPHLGTTASGLLHVGLSVGAETARTYLAVPDGAVTAGVDSAVLHLPLDLAAADGSSAPTKALIEVCTTKVAITAVDGSSAKPPATDCTTHVLAQVVGTASPGTEIVADLTPLLAALRTAGTNLALLPLSAPLASWEVTFTAATSTKAGATAPSLTVHSATAAGDIAPTTATGAPGDGSGAVVPAGPTDAGPAPQSLPLPTPISEPMSTAPAAQATVAAASSPVSRLLSALPHGFDYPAIFLLVLALGGGLLVVGRQLTQPLTPRRRSPAPAPRHQSTPTP